MSEHTWSRAAAILLALFAFSVDVSLGADAEADQASHESPAEETAGGDHAVDHGDGAAGDGHHDPYDLGHANAGPKLEDPSEWRYDMAICTFLVFIALFGLLSVVAWGPMMSGLQKREQAIASRIEDAERSAAAAEEQLREYQAKMAGAAEDAQAVIAQGRRDAEGVADKIRAQAQDDAVRERQRAIADIEAAKNNALQDIAAQSTDLAVSLAGQIVRRELRADDHTQLITESLKQFSNQN